MTVKSHFLYEAHFSLESINISTGLNRLRGKLEIVQIIRFEEQKMHLLLYF